MLVDKAVAVEKEPHGRSNEKVDHANQGTRADTALLRTTSKGVVTLALTPR